MFVCTHSILHGFERRIGFQKRNMADLASAIGTGLAGLSTFGGFYTWREKKRSEQQRTYKENILQLLRKPFIPPLKPKYGPLFHRPQWEESFKHLAKGDMYHVCHGPSHIGKSLAISYALKREEGIVYLNLSETPPQKIPARMAFALNFFGDKTFSESQVELDFMMRTFGEAAQELSKKPIVIVEGIQSCKNGDDVLHESASQIVAHLLELNSAGLVNVVYISSDVNGYLLLTKVSGHSRLSNLVFLPMEDELFVHQLWKLAYRKEPKLWNNKPRRAFRFVERDTGSKLDEDMCYVFHEHSEAQTLVDRLGSHMGDATAVLYSIVEEGQDVKSAIETVIVQGIPRLADIILGKQTGTVDRATLIVTADVLFKALSQPGVRQVHWYRTVTEKAPKINDGELIKAVDFLVSSHLLTYNDPFHVRLHARRLKWAYLTYLSTDYAVAQITKNYTNSFV